MSYVLPSMLAEPRRFRRLTRPLQWLAGRGWWADRDAGRRALAQVDDDHLDELSEIGRRVRSEERQRRVGN